MTWVRIDDKIPRHPKFVQLGMFKPFALALHLCALCYCNEYLTDGHIPWAQVGELLNLAHLGYEVAGNDMSSIGRDADPYQIAAAMVDAGIWHETEDGYFIHDYLEYQPSRESVEAKRNALHDVRSDAGKLGAVARWAEHKKAQADDGKLASGMAKGMANEWQGDSPKPVPVPEEIETPRSCASYPQDDPNPAIGYWESKLDRSLNADELRSVKRWVRAYGLEATTTGLGYALRDGFAEDLGRVCGQIKVIAKGAES